MTNRGPKPRVTWNGQTYTCRRWNIDVPDLAAMDRMAALVWLNQNTIPLGLSRTAPEPNLAGLTLHVGPRRD